MKCIFLFILLFQFTTIDSYCIPVIFHNLSIYDAHFISKDIATAYEGYTELLPIIKEKYISFTKYIDTKNDKKKSCIKLRIIDSFKFLGTIQKN